MNNHYFTECQVRRLETDADVYGVYDGDGRLLGAGSREACQHFLEMLRHPHADGDYSSEALASLFERWQNG